MNEHEIDRILSTEPVIEPRAGFAARVMRDVRLEADLRTEPLPFPWRRFLPGFLTAVGLGLATFVVMSRAAAAGVEVFDAAAFTRSLVGPVGQGLAIVVVSTGGSLLAAWLGARQGPRRLRL